MLQGVTYPPKMGCPCDRWVSVRSMIVRAAVDIAEEAKVAARQVPKPSD